MNTSDFKKEVQNFVQLYGIRAIREMLDEIEQEIRDEQRD